MDVSPFLFCLGGGCGKGEAPEQVGGAGRFLIENLGGWEDIGRGVGKHGVKDSFRGPKFLPSLAQTIPPLAFSRFIV